MVAPATLEAKWQALCAREKEIDNEIRVETALQVR